MNEDKERDLYDSILDGVATFGGLFALVLVRYATTGAIVPNDSAMKRILRETGSISLSTAAMGITQQAIKTVGAGIKPWIVK